MAGKERMMGELTKHLTADEIIEAADALDVILTEYFETDKGSRFVWGNIIRELAAERDELAAYAEGLRQALEKIAFQDQFPDEVNALHGNPNLWPTTIAYRALGGRMRGTRLDTLESLRSLKTKQKD